jgi:hypothetical protein
MSKVQRRPNFAAPGISARAAMSCTVRIGRPMMAIACSMVPLSTLAAVLFREVGFITRSRS